LPSTYPFFTRAPWQRWLMSIKVLSKKSDLSATGYVIFSRIRPSMGLLHTHTYPQVFSDPITPPNYDLPHVRVPITTSLHCHLFTIASPRQGHSCAPCFGIRSLPQVSDYFSCVVILLTSDVPVQSCALRLSFFDDYHEASTCQWQNTRTPKLFNLSPPHRAL
jgi:hypothetical protein